MSTRVVVHVCFALLSVAIAGCQGDARAWSPRMVVRTKGADAASRDASHSSAAGSTTELDATTHTDAVLDAAADGGNEASAAPDGLVADATAHHCSLADDAGRSDCTNGRRILVGEVVNARDLGGTAIEHAGSLAFGQLYRGPPLSGLTSQGCADFALLGIRTVIDLRTKDERDQTPSARCVSETTHSVLAPLPVPYSVSPDDYIRVLNTTDSIAAVFRALGDAAAYPIYFHCTYGRDRTGVLAAVILLALGASRPDIMQEYLLSGPLVGAYPNSLAAVLDEIARGGGIAAYLAKAGVSEAQLATLRAQLTAQ